MWKQQGEGGTVGITDLDVNIKTQKTGFHIWTQCTCHNGAVNSSIISIIAALLLIAWTLLAV